MGKFFVHSDEIKKNQKKSRKPLDNGVKMCYNSANERKQQTPQPQDGKRYTASRGEH